MEWLLAGDSGYALGLVLAVIAALLLASKIVDWLLRKVQRRVTEWHREHRPPDQAQKSDSELSDQAQQVLGRMSQGVRLVLLLIALYVCVPAILSVFPASRHIAATLLPYAWTPVEQLIGGLIGFAPNLLSILVIAIVTRYLVRFIRFLLGEIDKGTIYVPGFHAEWAQPTPKLLCFLIVLFAVVLASPYLPGFGSPAFQGISIFLGVLLSLGSTAVVANLVAGTALIYMRAFNVGDRVKIADTFGDVIEKTLLITRVRTVKNVEVTIPNAMVLGNHMITYSGMTDETGLILHTTVTIGYDAPWRHVHERLIAAAKATACVKDDPAPFILQTALNDFTVAYELNIFTTEARLSLEILSELHQNIQDKFNEAGIEIMSPHFTSLRDGNSIAVPVEYLSKAAPAKSFRIVSDTIAK
ncbi:MAG: mechanosensitive ion channel [Deltaproteobacteria bacterium]|nr:mechanosensitive ion channel [Deltaproteobacteria bacterium]